MEYVELHDFEQFVDGRKLVPEKYRSYYLSWVRRFLQSDFTAQDLSEKDAVTCFVDRLIRDSSVEDWPRAHAEYRRDGAG